MADRYLSCGECGNLFGRYFMFFEQAKRAYYAKEIFNNEKYKNFNPSKLYHLHDNKIDLQHIFDALRIEKNCCRMHLISYAPVTNMPTKVDTL